MPERYGADWRFVFYSGTFDTPDVVDLGTVCVSFLALWKSRLFCLSALLIFLCSPQELKDMVLTCTDLSFPAPLAFLEKYKKGEEKKSSNKKTQFLFVAFLFYLRNT